jgi:predicted ATPase
MAPLSLQGHGVRSFVGLYLTLATLPYPIVVVDEPEAFLHPPQARALGLEIARLSARNNTQVILATHSLDLLKGILDYNVATATVIRLTRDGDQNSVSHLSAELINELWADPLLRFSGALDGLFIA